MQRFLIVGNKAYRDAMLAVQDPEFRPGTQVVAEFETTARINDFFAVRRYRREGEAIRPVGSFFARTIEEIHANYKPGELIEMHKLHVIPYLEPKRRGESAAA